MNKIRLWIFAVALLNLIACKQTDSHLDGVIMEDKHSIATGKLLFNQYCSTCHNFNFDGIGPRLGGITDTMPVTWIKDFIHNPQGSIDSGDARATRLFARYKLVMPPFVGLGDSSINQIIAYLHTRKALLLSSRYSDRAEVTNPIPDTIEMSDLVCDLKLIAQFPTTGKEGVAPLARITKLDYEPHSGQTYVLDMNGKLYKLINDQPVVYMDLTKLIPNLLLQPGLSSGYNNFAFHPEFYKNGLLYTAHSEPAATKKADFAVDDTLEAAMQFVITEWKVSNPMQSSFEGQGRELFRIDMVSKAHGVQEIAFNPIAKPGTEDYGLLYISIGDAGAGENRYPFLLHSTRRAWGSLFRIDPNSQNQTARPSKNGHYGIPLSNPFASDPGAIGELYAYGFRNPHRITWTQKGQLLLSNIGHGDIEALDWVRPGQDYGWPYMEGEFVIDPFGDLTKVYEPIATDTLAPHIPAPIAQFDHDEAKAIAGGYEYKGSISALKGKFLFGDIPVGNLYFINTSDIKEGATARVYEYTVTLNGEPFRFKELNKKDRVELHFGQDAQGEIYMMTKADGKLYKIVKATRRVI